MIKMIPVTIMAMLILSQQDCPANRPGDGVRSPTAQEARVLGIVDYSDDRTRDVVIAPNSVRAGEDFQVTVTTFGGGCERKGDTSVISTDTGATIMVYDFTTATRPEVTCAMVLRRITHTITLRFTKPGEALIRVWGRRIGADTPLLGAPTVLDHRVMVSTTDIGQVPDHTMPAAQWTVSETGAGPIRFGMTVAEASRALGGALTPLSPPALCYYMRPARGPSGVSFMVVDDRIARVDVNDRSVVATFGARIGDSEGRIKALYPRVETARQKYTNGHYLTVMPAGEYRIIFETDGAKVTRYRAGRLPEVTWVEGCS